MRNRLLFFLIPLALLIPSCGQRTVHNQPLPSRESISKRPVHTETIVIDAGHGGKDSGSRSDTHNYEEKQLTLSTARMVRDYLQEMGYKTILTRDDDLFVPLDDRAQIANANNVTLFVSVHYNHCPDPSVQGIEIFYYKDEKTERHVHSNHLGDTILSQLVWHTGAEARGIKRGKFAVIRQTKMPAVLVEAGFLSHPKEREKIKDPMYRRFIAKGIARGVDHYI
nr:N-acetylmuramoyl-L-alanine amidase LytC [Chlamydiota bacterium]